ncbi:MAG TPA: hypothetical protein VGE43_19415 [Acidimicrobiales bacterium]
MSPAPATTAHLRVDLVGISDRERRAYRLLRRSGLSRHDCNLIVLGMCMATGLLPEVRTNEPEARP